jgi:two-component system sensor histidine kinase PilS (NtrC family)
MPSGPTAFAVSDSAGDTAESLWRSLGYFNLYRVAVASLFLAAGLLYSANLADTAQARRFFAGVNLAYFFAAVGFVLLQRRRWPGFDLLLTLGVFCDIAALTLMMYASGGAKGGLAIMLMIALAGAGLVGHGRMTLLFAAMATIAVLVEQAHRALQFPAESVDFVLTGITCVGFFATAIIARLVARRVIANQELARQRGIDLANQLWISERIIREVQDGVLVASPAGAVRQFNPQAAALFGVTPPANADLGSFSASLAAAFAAHESAGGEREVPIPLPGNDQALRARFVSAGRGGDVLVLLEDLRRFQSQARQLKLAALGRLTANIAHEIRNPLAAIMHAAELLREEKRTDMQQRLIRILIDNGQRLERLVRDVLELGRRDRREPEALSLAQFLPVFLDEFCLHEQVPRALFALEADERATLIFDRAHVNQVLWNLLSNALRYASRGEGAIRILGRATADSTELHVIDDGPGIAPEQRAQVFEPFFTTHSKGTGLGLYIARELSEANEAALELVEGSGGAHFRITGRGRP